MPYTEQDMKDVDALIMRLLNQREALAVEITSAFVKRRRIRDKGFIASPPVSHPRSAPTNQTDLVGLKQEFASAFALPTKPEPAPKRKQHQLQNWTADQIIAENLKRSAEGLPPMWGTEEALEDLAKQPPAD